MSSNYWSSTTNANNTNNAWHVNFNNGNVNNNNKSNSYYVRAVPSGKCELFSFFSAYQAYLDCRKRKRGTVNALRLGEETALLIRVGKYYELFGNDATAHAPPLGLRLYPSKRGALRAAGFPAWMKNRYINKFLRLGTSVAIIEQNGPGKFVINRYVNSIFIFGGKECESL